LLQWEVGSTKSVWFDLFTDSLDSCAMVTALLTDEQVYDVFCNLSGRFYELTGTAFHVALLRLSPDILAAALCEILQDANEGEKENK